jgi:hypothetical protein
MIIIKKMKGGDLRCHLVTGQDLKVLGQGQAEGQDIVPALACLVL